MLTSTVPASSSATRRMVMQRYMLFIVGYFFIIFFVRITTAVPQSLTTTTLTAATIALPDVITKRRRKLQFGEDATVGADGSGTTTDTSTTTGDTTAGDSGTTGSGIDSITNTITTETNQEEDQREGQTVEGAQQQQDQTVQDIVDTVNDQVDSTGGDTIDIPQDAIEDAVNNEGEGGGWTSDITQDAIDAYDDVNSDNNNADGSTTGADETSSSSSNNNIDNIPSTGDFLTNNIPFAYTLYTNSDQIDVGTATNLFETSTIASIQQLIDETGTDILVDYQGDTSYTECIDVDEQIMKDFDTCFEMVDNIVAQIDPLIPSGMVDRVFLDYVQDFIGQFNDQNPDMRVIYAFPVYLKAAVKVSLEGVDSVMNLKQKDFFLATFNVGFGTVMATKAQPSLLLRETKLTLQEVSPTADSNTGGTGNTATRLLQSNSDNGATTIPAEKSLELQMLVQASCSNKECIDNDALLKDFILSGGNIYSPTLVLALQTGGPIATNSDYFNSLTRIVFGDKLLGDNFTLPESLPPYDEPMDPMDWYGVPFWVWVALGVDIFILLIAMIIVAFRRTKHAADHKRSMREKQVLERNEPIAIVVDEDINPRQNYCHPDQNNSFNDEYDRQPELNLPQQDRFYNEKYNNNFCDRQQQQPSDEPYDDEEYQFGRQQVNEQHVQADTGNGRHHYYVHEDDSFNPDPDVYHPDPDYAAARLREQEEYEHEQQRQHSPQSVQKSPASQNSTSRQQDYSQGTTPPRSSLSPKYEAG